MYAHTQVHTYACVRTHTSGQLEAVNSCSSLTIQIHSSHKLLHSSRKQVEGDCSLSTLHPSLRRPQDVERATLNLRPSPL